MANIATLAVSITANTDKFIKGINKATAELQAFAATSAKYATVAAGAAATGLALLVKESLANIDATAKLADRVGLTTEQLTGLQHAANLAGVGNESLRIGMEKLLKTLQPGQDPSAELMRIADQMKAMKDPAERAQFAMEKFGKSGQELIPLLMGGSEALRQMAAENERLGGSFSRVDAAKVEAANDAVSKLWQVIKGVGNTLAIELAPFIKAAADGLVRMATEGKGVRAQVAGAFEASVLGAAKLLDYFAAIQAGWQGLKVSVDLFVLGVTHSFRLLGDAANALSNKLGKGDVVDVGGLKRLETLKIQDTTKDIVAMNKAWGDFANGTYSQKAIQGIRNIQIEQEKASRAAADAAAAANAPRGTFGEYVDLEALKNKRAMDETAKAADEAQAKLDDWAKGMAESIRTPWQVFEEEAAKAAKALSEGLLNKDQYNAALDKLAKDREAALGKLEFKGPAEVKTGEIKQFDLSRINVRGLSSGTKKQEVKAPEMEDLLKKQLETSKSIDSGIKNLDLGFA